MTGHRAFAALLLAAPLACGGETAGDGPSVREFVVDTLEGGAIRVRNPDEGTWGEGEAWTLVEELRIGSADEAGAEAFTGIVGLALGPAGRIYVLDRGEPDVRVFTPSGEWVRTIGREGGGPGEFRHPSGLRFGPEGNLWVVDGARYSVFDTTGAFVESHRRPAPGSGFVQGFSFDDRGRLLEIVPVFDTKGQRMTLLRHRPGEMRVDTLAFPGYRQPWVRRESRNRAIFSTVPFTARLMYEFVEDGVWVGTGETYRLVFTTFDGDTVRVVEKSHRPVPVTDEEVERLRRAARDRPGVALDLEEVDLPESHPAFSGILLAPTGHLWVGTSSSGDDPGGIDVFDPEGRYLGRGRSETPFSFHSHAFDENRLYATTWDELGVPYVIGLRVERGRGGAPDGEEFGG